ncbi:MAG: hypothetical protein JEZ11_04500 [Desulfobacterales bacterium]|nr:hypothetical protein [Desulfobacterales bacterium]
MPLFQKKRRVQETIDAFKEEMAAVQEDLDGFKKCVEKELGGIRKDFRELVIFLQESPEPEDNESNGTETRSEGKAAAGEDPTILPELKDDLSHLSDRVTEMAEQTEALCREVETVKNMVNDEMKSVRDGIAEAKRDIINKITYGFARLRT